MNTKIEFAFELGQTVEVIPIFVRGFIDGMMTEQKKNQYRVVYWIDGKRFQEWLTDREIRE